VTVDELLGRIGSNVSVQRVFGEPIDRDGITVVPVAVVAGGGGAGGGQQSDGSDSGGSDGSGGGFGLWSRGIGVYAIQDGQVRFVPAVDVVALGLAGAMVLRLLFKAAGAAGRRRRGD
jgi:uncharacterized spore protein YtfJ